MHHSRTPAKIGALLAACMFLTSCGVSTPNGNRSESDNYSISQNNTVDDMTYAIAKGWLSADADGTAAVTPEELYKASSKLVTDHNLPPVSDYQAQGLLPGGSSVTKAQTVTFLKNIWGLTDENLTETGLSDFTKSEQAETELTNTALAAVLRAQEDSLALSGINTPASNDAAQNGSEALYERIKESYTRTELLDIFHTTALDAEYSDKEDQTEHNTLRWAEDEISYSLQGENISQPVRDLLANAIEQLESVPGLPDFYEDQSGNGKIQIQIGTDKAEQYLNQYRASGFCTVSFSEDDSLIQKANIYTHAMRVGGENQVPSNGIYILSEDTIQHIFLEELTQAMGLINDHPDLPESVLDEGSGRIPKLADIDRLLLEMLYSEGIPANLTPDEADTAAAGWLDTYLYA